MAPTLRRIHLVFKTHLDLGFTDLAGRVVARYVEEFIPRAIALSGELRAAGGPERFVWTTGSWLVHEYLERASNNGRLAMERAIEAGDICWHALPFTLHSELLSPALFEAGLDISHRLDRRFGRITVAAKMSDVPGHTRGIVPLLARADVRFLHIGVNSASAVPDVSPAFRWREPGSGDELVVVYHGGGYGGIATVGDAEAGLALAHTNDNHGPQTIDQVLQVYRDLRARFPEATVQASTLDAFAAEVLPLAVDLPVLEDEIGDTWIHGAGSDPAKVSRFRELCRLHRSWQLSGAGQGAKWPRAFGGYLLLVPEHTWGLDEKTCLGDDTRYAPKELAGLRGEPKARRFEESWREQREYLDRALAALPPEHAAQTAARLAALEPVRPQRQGFVPVAAGAQVETEHFNLSLDGRGALVSLIDLASGRQWAAQEQPLGLFSYELFSAADYQRFWNQYIVATEQNRGWALRDFTKPGIDQVGPPEHQVWEPEVRWLGWRQDEEEDRLLVEMALPLDAVAGRGGPEVVTMEVVAPRHQPEVRITFQWFQKAACRLPEAMWVSFRPLARDPEGWSFEKLGTWVSPRRVVRRGGRTLHAVERRVVYRDAHGCMTLETLDAPLVAPGRRSLLDFHDRLPEAGDGVHVNLYNNVWGTNFPMWYEDDARFRFSLRFGTGVGGADLQPSASGVHGAGA